MELLILIAVIVCAAAWWNMRAHRKEGGEDGQEAQWLILETRSVVADFLECGELVQMLSREKYMGTISVRLHARAHGRLGYTVCMYDTGDIGRAFSEFQKEFPEADFPELRQFTAAYGRCYDAQRDALVYTTGHCAKLTGEERAAMEREVYLKIAAHPLAEMEDLSRIHTKYLGMK